MATTYQSFAGVDIHAVFDNKVFGELQMVQYSISREKAPVYTMGHADMRTIARGKRTVVGKCVFVVFDRDTLLEHIKDGDRRPYLDKTETAAYNSDNTATAQQQEAINQGGSYNTLGGATDVDYTSLTTQADPRLADQVLPFDITLVAANEYGNISKMMIYGVELMSEAGGVSIDDLVIEKQMDFIARRVSSWQVVREV